MLSVGLRILYSELTSSAAAWIIRSALAINFHATFSISLTNANAGQGSTAKIIGGFVVGESDDFVLKVHLHWRSKTNANMGVRVVF